MAEKRRTIISAVFDQPAWQLKVFMLSLAMGCCISISYRVTIMHAQHNSRRYHDNNDELISQPRILVDNHQQVPVTHNPGARIPINSAGEFDSIVNTDEYVWLPRLATQRFLDRFQSKGERPNSRAPSFAFQSTSSEPFITGDGFRGNVRLYIASRLSDFNCRFCFMLLLPS